ncbi:MAG: DUF6544 family protein [Opitutaceae bacterium]
MLRRRFTAHLDAIEAAVRESHPGQKMRTDLPPEVVALAARLGVRPDGVSRFAAFTQSGQMWRTPGGKPMDFTARQTMGVGATGFLWRARMGSPVSVAVADYFSAGVGGLEVRLLGLFPLVRMVGGAAANQGEILRYLAELPWNADAILANSSLDWTIIGPNRITVATGVGADRGEVTFDLDERGLVARASAPSRIYAAKGGATARPWHGRFWDYQHIGGRFIPRQGEVAWGLDTGDFVYWRGRLTDWNC